MSPEVSKVYMDAYEMAVKNLDYAPQPLCSETDEIWYISASRAMDSFKNMFRNKISAERYHAFLKSIKDCAILDPKWCAVYSPEDVANAFKIDLNEFI